MSSDAPTPDVRQPIASNVIVASHPRSGTHFLINTLALNFGFDPEHVDSDIMSGVDFYRGSQIEIFLEKIRAGNERRIVKDHHHFSFFATLGEYLRRNFTVFYIYRNPADTMCSYWRYVLAAERREGPRCRTVGNFIRWMPRAGMLRYQIEQHATVLERWRSHVDAWTTRGVAEANVIPIKYEDLNLEFAATVERIGRALGMKCPNPTRPSLTANVMVPGKGQVAGFRRFMNEDDIAYVREHTQATLARLDLARFLE